MAFSFGDFVSGVGDFVTGGDGFDAGDVFRNISGAAGAYDALQGTDPQKPYFYPGQERGLELAGQAAIDRFKQGPQGYYPGSTVAPLDPNVISGQNKQLGLDQRLTNMANVSGTAAGTLAQGGSDRVGGFQLPGQVGFDLPPEYQSAITNPIYRDLEQRILPQINTQATQQGAFGGSRMAQQRGQAGAEATERATDALIRGNLTARGQTIGQRAGDISAQLTGRGQDVQQNAIENAARAAGISGTGSSMAQQLLPGQVATDIGGSRTQYEQALIDADKARFDFNQGSQDTNLDRLFSRLQGLPPIPGAGGQEGNWLDALQGFGVGTNIYGALTTPPASTAIPRV